MVLRAWRFFIKLFIKPLFPSATNFQRCRKLRLEEDRISALPDDVLSNILPLLRLKAAVSTGILSKRWRCLWKQRLLSLNFNYEHVRNLMDHEAFLLMVNQFIRQYESPYLREFILHCRLDHLSTEPIRYIYRLIDGWIAFAISRGVSTLDLDFGVGDCRYPMSLTLLDKKTNGLIMEPYLKHRFFKTIKELRLSCIKLSDKDFDAILARCSSLEHLRLSDVRKLINLKHDTPLQKLRQLEVYFMEDLENLVLVVPCLVSFKYQGPKINIHFVDAPVLANITMVSYLGLREYKWVNSLGAVYPERKEFVFGQFAAYLSQLQYLLMDASSLMERGAFLEVPVFGSLKKLLIYNITSKYCCYAVTSFLKISLLLQRLELHLDKDRMQCDKEEQKPKLTSVSLHKNLKQAWILERQKRKLNPASLHRNLKEAWISGFCGELADMIVAEHILKRAPALEKMEITTYRTIWLWGNMTCYKPDLPNVRECFSKFHLSLPRTAQLYFYHYDNYVDS